MKVGDPAVGGALILLGVLAGYITLTRRWPIVLLAILYPWDVTQG